MCFLEEVCYEEWRAFRVGGGLSVALRARDSTLEERQEALEKLGLNRLTIVVLIKRNDARHRLVQSIMSI